MRSSLLSTLLDVQCDPSIRTEADDLGAALDQL
jgi:hypothetical protein